MLVVDHYCVGLVVGLLGLLIVLVVPELLVELLVVLMSLLVELPVVVVELVTTVSSQALLLFGLVPTVSPALLLRPTDHSSHHTGP